MKFHSQFSKRTRVCLDVSVPDGFVRPKQSFKDECDINSILRNYRSTGSIGHISSGRAKYGDFSSIGDYSECLNVVIAAQEEFMALPAKVRARFSNDPAKFISFCSDPSNADELIRFGLATAKPVVPAKGTPDAKPQGLPAVGEGPKP